MPYRSPTLVSNEFYHIYNRSIAYEKIFSSKMRKNIFLNMMYYYNTDAILPYSFSKHKSSRTIELQHMVEKSVAPGVEIVAFAIMPTHFHLLLKQTKDGDVSRYLRRLEVSYAKSYNRSKVRHGGVFAGRFSSVLIRSQYHLQIVARYIHLNPVKAKIITIDELDTYPFTSYHLIKNPNKYVHDKYFLDGFDDKYEYSIFLRLGLHDSLEYIAGDF